MKQAIIILSAAVFVFGVWSVSFYVTMTAWNAAPERLRQYGVFGESFGAVNALFAGLALVGVVIALGIEAHGAKQQRTEFLVQTRISNCAAIIEAEKTLSEYYLQAAQAAKPGDPPPIPSEPSINWADMIQVSRKRILEMGAELEKARSKLMNEDGQG